MENQVLIVDDEEIILQTLQVIFKRAGIQVDTMSNPVEALRLFPQRRYNMVIVDVLMPQMMGVDVIRAVKSLNPLCNVIVMTAFSTMARVIECIEAGACDYVTKPFADINLLVNVVRVGLERVARWEKSFGVELDDGATHV